MLYGHDIHLLRKLLNTKYNRTNNTKRNEWNINTEIVRFGTIVKMKTMLNVKICIKCSKYSGSFKHFCCVLTYCGDILTFNVQVD